MRDGVSSSTLDKNLEKNTKDFRRLHPPWHFRRHKTLLFETQKERLPPEGVSDVTRIHCDCARVRSEKRFIPLCCEERLNAEIAGAAGLRLFMRHIVVGAPG